MLDVSTLTTPLHTLLAANAELVAAGATVERGTRVNFDPARCPWVGVYPGSVDTEPRTVGAHWKDTAVIQVVVQTASFSDDGQAASDTLEDLLGKVMDAINTDLTLGVVGVRVVRFSREYRYVVFDDDGAGDLFMPQAIIKISCDVRSN